MACTRTRLLRPKEKGRIERSAMKVAEVLPRLYYLLWPSSRELL